MNRKNLILSVVAIFLTVIIFLGIGIYYFLLYLQDAKNIPVVNTEIVNNKIEKPVLPDPKQQLEQLKKDYPEIIQGIIRFFDTKTLLKTTIKTDDGKEYILWPAQPKSVYESFGAKNNGRVEIQARVLGKEKLEWGLMKPIY